MIVNPYAQTMLQTNYIEPAGTTSVGRNKTARQENSGGQDEVVLSDQARSFATVLQKAKNDRSVRMDKVEKLSQQVAQGEYNVAADDIADKMMHMQY